MQRESVLREAFVEFADTLVRDFDVLEFLHTVSLRCADLLNVDAVGLMLTDGSAQLRIVAASNEEARLLELFEVQNDEGPCMDCFQTGTPVFDVDLETTERWPRFRIEAINAGFSSVMAVPLRLRDEVIGAMNLFARAPGRMGERDRALSQALADVATIGLIQERSLRESRLVAEQLQSALNNRVVIEQAKGVVGERLSLDMDAAFELMRSYARSRNLRLHELAHDVIAGRLQVTDLSSVE